MKAKKIASILFFASLFGFIVIWGYLPKLWLMSWLQWSLLGVTVLSLAAWAIFSLESLAQWIKKRATHYWIDLAIKTVAVALILGVVNWIAVDRNWKKDFTINKMHSLSDQSEKILKDLKEPITLTIWSANVDEMTTNISAKKFFENYKIKGGGKVNLQIKNPIEDPVGAEKDNVAKKRHLVIVRTASGSEARVENFTDSRAEELVTNAILQATKRGRRKTICFLSGHNELSIENTEAGGISILKDRLTSSSYETKDVMLASMEAIPNNCDALALVGPQGDPLEKETRMIADYLEQGGRMIALLGAGTSPVWKNSFKKYGIEVRNDIVIDPNVQPPIGVLTKNFAQDIDIAKGLNGATLMLQSSSINVASESPEKDATLRTFISSETYTYTKEGNLKTIKDVRRAGSDRKGPLALGVVFEKKIKSTEAAPSGTPAPKTKDPGDSKTSMLRKFFIPEAQAQEHHEHDGHDHAQGTATAVPEVKDPDAKEMSVIIYGNHYFVANSFITQFINMDLILNSFNYVLKDKGEMGLRPREIRQATLELTSESINQVMATLALLGLFFVVGALWAKARRAHAA